MWDIFLAILGLANPTMDRLRRWHAIAARYFFLALAIVLIGYGLNIIGFGGVNLIFCIIFNIAAIILATRPEPLAATVALGVASGLVRTPQTVADEMRSILTKYIRAIGQAMLWTSMIFFVLGTASFRESPTAFLIIVCAIIILGIASELWNMGGKFKRRFVVWYTTAALLCSLFLLIPSHTWIRWTGYDVKGAVSTPERDITLERVEKAINKAQEDDDVEILKSIQEKVERGEELTAQEKMFLKIMKEQRDKNTIPRKLSVFFSETPTQPAPYERPAPAPAPALEPAPAPAPVPIPELIREKWEICWFHPTDGQQCKEGAVLIKNDGLRIEIPSFKNGGILVFEGKKENEGFKGSWNFSGPTRLSGTFRIRFRENLGEGEMTDAKGDVISLIARR